MSQFQQFQSIYLIQIVQYFISNFLSTEDPSKVWIGEIIKNGETTDYLKDKISSASFYIDTVMIPSLETKSTVQNAHKNLHVIRNIQ